MSCEKRGQEIGENYSKKISKDHKAITKTNQKMFSKDLRAVQSKTSVFHLGSNRLLKFFLLND